MQNVENVPFCRYIYNIIFTCICRHIICIFMYIYIYIYLFIYFSIFIYTVCISHLVPAFFHQKWVKLSYVWVKLNLMPRHCKFQSSGDNGRMPEISRERWGKSPSYRSGIVGGSSNNGQAIQEFKSFQSFECWVSSPFSKNWRPYRYIFIYWNIHRHVRYSIKPPDYTIVSWGLALPANQQPRATEEKALYHGRFRWNIISVCPVCLKRMEVLLATQNGEKNNKIHLNTDDSNRWVIFGTCQVMPQSQITEREKIGTSQVEDESMVPHHVMIVIPSVELWFQLQFCVVP